MLNIYKRKIKNEIKESLKTVYKQTILYSGQDKNQIKVNLYFVNKSNIKLINKNTREINKVTDVLSFPYFDLKIGEVIADKKYILEKDPEDNKYLLGEIFICNSVAKKQAKAFNHSYKREVAFLLTHGLLHLLGYDHIEEIDRVLMEKVQQEILSKCDIGRDK